ncbi:uncharacterized protein [Venturia canescens]|uniref:uncharacterized protein n=1 Tax=Venturia canescens TaxID=32260 RepID=UPI001C9CBA58|nr:uncharacterized protein LOC122407265 [Venturia canescens]
MERKRKRHSWEILETKYFLDLVRRRKETNNLDGKRFRVEDIFAHLEIPMAKRGYVKTSKQMQMRFKTLRMQYHQYKRSLGQSEAEDSHNNRFLFYDQMEEILDDRPTADDKRIIMEDDLVYEEEVSLSEPCSPSPTFMQDKESPCSAIGTPSLSRSPVPFTSSDVQEKSQQSSSMRTVKRKRGNTNSNHTSRRQPQKPSEEQAFCNYLQFRLEKLERRYFLKVTNTILLEIMKIEAAQAEEQE